MKTNATFFQSNQTNYPTASSYDISTDFEQLCKRLREAYIQQPGIPLF